MDLRLLGALVLFARAVGVVTAVGGLLLLPANPVFGVPLFAVGLLLVVRPAAVGRVLDFVGSPGPTERATAVPIWRHWSY